jgi:O-antigen ligase
LGKKKSKKVKQSTKKKDLHVLYLAPILFIVTIVPLIVYGKVLEIDGLEMLNWKGGNTIIDFFSYYKAIYFSVASFGGFVLLLLLKLTGQFEFKKSKYLIPLGIYVLAVLLSYGNAVDKVVATRGFVELFQGVFVLVGYALTVISVIYYVQNETHVKVVVGGYVFVGVVTAIIGFTQYFGFDLFRTLTVRYMILPDYLHHIAEELQFTFGANTIYATMYNTNFVGSFAALLIPIAIVLYLYSKTPKQKVLSSAFTIMMFFVLFGSNSRAGLVGVALGLVVLAVLLRYDIKTKPKQIIVPLAVALVVLVALNVVSDGRVVGQITRLNPFSERERVQQTSETRPRFEALNMEGYSLEIVTEAESMRMIHDGETLKFETLEGEPLDVVVNDQRTTFEDERYRSFRFDFFEEEGKINARAYHGNFDIYFLERGFAIASSGGVLATTQDPPRVKWMDGYEQFASSRGYIWSRSVPMLKDSLLVGQGPDMYAIAFPQQDFVGKANSFSSHTTIVDKPHNLYLQIGINTGVLSLLALMAVYVLYAKDSLALYFRKKEKTFLDFMGIGAFSGVMAYLGAGFFNDQIISVAPLFYVLTGFGIAVNQLVISKEGSTKA